MFCKQFNIKNTQFGFFTDNGKPFWTVAVEYEPKSQVKMRINDVTIPQSAVLTDLINWRNQQAKSAGFPPFLIATNKQLALMVEQKIKYLKDFELIKGFGAKRTEKYGKQILEIIDSVQK